MALMNRAARWAGMRASRRMSRSLPWVGGLIGLFTLGAAVRRKGLFRGTLDTGLNALPVVGALKLGAESLRGRDFVADRPGAPSPTATPRG